MWFAAQGERDITAPRCPQNDLCGAALAPISCDDAGCYSRAGVKPSALQGGPNRDLAMPSPDAHVSLLQLYLSAEVSLRMAWCNAPHNATALMPSAVPRICV